MSLRDPAEIVRGLPQFQFYKGDAYHLQNLQEPQMWIPRNKQDQSKVLVQRVVMKLRVSLGFNVRRARRSRSNCNVRSPSAR